jgi:hypothetical protein
MICIHVRGAVLGSQALKSQESTIWGPRTQAEVAKYYFPLATCDTASALRRQSYDFLNVGLRVMCYVRIYNLAL